MKNANVVAFDAKSVAIGVVGVAYMRPDRFAACGPHICGPYTPSGEAVSRRCYIGIAGFSTTLEEAG